jgi:DNA-binding GntR family transcriptional regulator
MAEVISSSFKIDRMSTVDQVADRLRRMIWAGELPPGYRLREIPLAKSFGVSRNTVRDAIRDLSQEGLISHELHRGGVVTSLDADDVADLYNVRRLLELNAVTRSSKNQPELQALEQSVLTIERALEVEDWEAVVEADSDFHRAVVSLLRSRRFNRFFDQIRAEYRFAIGVLWLQDAAGQATPVDTAEDLAEVAAAHRKVYELIRDGRRGDARRALEEHLVKNEKRLSDILAARRTQDGDSAASA